MSAREIIAKTHHEHKRWPKYELVAPEGGWGHMITLAVAVSFIVTIVPLCGFGMIYGNFLATVSDETSGTTLVNGVFNTVISFTGLLANQMLQKYDYRRVAIIGSVIFFFGAFISTFVQSLTGLVITFGIIQGLGFGLILPSTFTAFNFYFDTKKNLMMSICQALMVAFTIAWPGLINILMENYGFRGTVALVAAISLHALVAALTLQPIEWHLVKKLVTDIELEPIDETSEPQETNKTNRDTIKEEKLLMVPKYRHSVHDLRRRPSHHNSKPRLSVISMGSLGLSITNLNKHYSREIIDDKMSIWKHMAKLLDLELLKDLKYLNISFGLSLSLTSDMAFLSILPLVLTEYGCDTGQVTTVLMVFFTSDLVCRILLSVANAIWLLRNRYIFLLGTLLSAAFRMAFVYFHNNYSWLLVTSAILGFLRCFIQTPLPLVIAEEYNERFTTAFSLYMVIGGIVALVVALALGAIKSLTSSNTMVVHVLTLAYLLCGVPWCIELMGNKLFGANKLDTEVIANGH